MRCSALLIVLVVPLLATAAVAQVPPPAPAAGASATAFACSRDTLLHEQACTVEGRTAAQATSREQARENQRSARVFAEELCRVLARSDEVDGDAGLLSVCSARAVLAVKRCGGDGSRRLLDDAGRFNPGHARCYGALAGLVSELSALADTASPCCACIADRCDGSATQCVESIGAGGLGGRTPAGTCAASTCSAPCAALRLVAPRNP